MKKNYIANYTLNVFVFMLSIFFFSSTLILANGLNRSLIDASIKAQPRKRLVLDELSLFNLLSSLQENFNKAITELRSEDKIDMESVTVFSKASYLTTEALGLLSDIIAGFNKKAIISLPEIEYSFIKMCNTLKNVDINDIAPRHIRCLYEAVEKLNQRVVDYRFDRGGFLSKDDIQICNSVTKLNHILLFGLLKEEYFDIDTLSMILDLTIHRPFEFMHKHPLVVTLIVAAIAATISYYAYNSHNKNPYAVIDLAGAQQSGAQCGIYAVLNAIAVSGSQNEVDARDALRRAGGNRNAANILINQVIANRRMAGHQPNSEWLRHDEIQALLDNPQTIHAVMHELGLQQHNNSPIVAIQNPRDLNIGSNELTAEFCEGVDALRHRGEPQTVVMYYGNNTQGAHGHWITVRVMPDNQALGGFRAWSINSGLGNYSNTVPVRVLMDVYNRGNDIPLPDHLQVLERIQGANSLLNPEVAGEPIDIASRSFDRLRNGVVELLNHNGNFFSNGQHNRHSVYCQDIFNTNRNHWLALGINNVTLPSVNGRAARNLNLDQCVSFENFVQWIQNP